MAKSEWVRVRSESELRPGMAVEVRPCLWCNRKERMILTAATQASPFAEMPTGMLRNTGARFGFSHVGGCRDNIPTQFDRTIRDGRLYRLRDLDEADETTEVTKELEVTRG